MSIASRHSASPTILTITSEVHRFKSVAGPEHDAPLHLILKGISDAALRQRISAPIEFLDRKQCRQLRDPKHQPMAMQLGSLDGIIVTSEYVDTVLDAVGTRFPCVTVTRWCY